MTPPELLKFEGDWASYEDVIYAQYHADIVQNRPHLWGKRIAARFNPETKGKGFSFWHVVSEGSVEEERTPDLQRCERIAWIAWLIDRCDGCHEGFSWWISVRTTKKGRRENLVLWAEDHDYVVILEPRDNHVMLVSAYPLHGRRAAKLKQDRDDYWGDEQMTALW